MKRLFLILLTMVLLSSCGMSRQLVLENAEDYSKRGIELRIEEYRISVDESYILLKWNSENIKLSPDRPITVYYWEDDVGRLCDGVGALTRTQNDGIYKIDLTDVNMSENGHYKIHIYEEHELYVEAGTVKIEITESTMDVLIK